MIFARAVGARILTQIKSALGYQLNKGMFCNIKYYVRMAQCKSWIREFETNCRLVTLPVSRRSLEKK